MLELRVYGQPPAIAAAAEHLDRLGGVNHLTVADTGRDGIARITADLRAEAADPALALLGRLGIAPDDVTLLRLESIGPVAAASESLALVWAEIVGRARLQARAPGRYFVFMAAAGVIAAFGVIDVSSILVVGAMAISPDLLPITAACTGLVLGRLRLVGHGLVTLVAGLAVTGAFALVVTLFLRVSGKLPDGFSLQEIPAAQSHVGTATILVALAAGVAGMLAVETRASSAVGVAISVTTVPAAAFFGVAVAIADGEHAVSALAVLGVNVTMMLAGGSAALAVQRALASRG